MVQDISLKDSIFQGHGKAIMQVKPQWGITSHLSRWLWERQKAKLMAPHSSTLAWKIPWTEEPGRLQSMGSQRVGHDWATSLSLFTFMHWRRKWQPTPVFLPGESQGRGILVGCCLWGRTESDMTEVIKQQQQVLERMRRHCHPCIPLVGMQKGTAALENSMVIPWNIF